MPNVRLDGDDGDVLVAVWETRVFRYLLADGKTLDVCAARDDSDVRDAVVERTSSNIVGVADVTGPRASPDSPGPKRRARGGSR